MRWVIVIALILIGVWACSDGDKKAAAKAAAPATALTATAYPIEIKDRHYGATGLVIKETGCHIILTDFGMTPLMANDAQGVWRQVGCIDGGYEKVMARVR